MIIEIFLHAFESNISNTIDLKIVLIEESNCCRNEDVYLIFLDCENSCIILALMVYLAYWQIAQSRKQPIIIN